MTEYEFDYRNRLVKVTEKNSAGGAATKIVTFQYDAFDRRTGKLLDADANGTIDRKTAWVWDGQQVAMQLVDADGAVPRRGSSRIATSMARRWIWSWPMSNCPTAGSA